MFTFLKSTMPSVEGMVTDSLQQLGDSIDLTSFSPNQIEQIKTISSNTLQQLSDEIHQESSTALIVPLICVLIVLGVGFYFYKRLNQDIKELRSKIKEQELLLQTYAITLESFESQLKNNESALSSLKMLPLNNQQKDDSANKKDNTSKTFSNQEKKKIVEQPSYLYADFYLDGTDALVEQRDLSSKVSDGTFQIRILEGTSKAVYTVNQSKEKAILEDLLNFTNFVDIQDIPASYSAIKVVNEGELMKTGASWKICKKLEVKLI